MKIHVLVNQTTGVAMSADTKLSVVELHQKGRRVWDSSPTTIKTISVKIPRYNALLTNGDFDEIFDAISSQAGEDVAFCFAISKNFGRD